MIEFYREKKLIKIQLEQKQCPITLMRAFVCYSLGEERQWTGKEDKHWSVCVCVCG